MSRIFTAVPQKQYQGGMTVRPMTLLGRLGQVVPLVFSWAGYGASTALPNLNVLVDLSPDNIASKLKEIHSIYIDNMGSANPIYVYFPSTDYSIVAQPNSAGWFRVYTADFNLQVIGEGFLTGNIPITKLLVANVDVNPTVDLELQQAITLWRASATITRGSTIYNQDFGTPALGDQTAGFQLDLTTLSTAPIFTSVFTGFIYLTFYTANLINVSDPALTGGNFFLESTGAAGLLYSVQFGVGTVAIPNTPILAIPSQLKLDGTQTWRFRNLVALGTGKVQGHVVFSTNPS